MKRKGLPYGWWRSETFSVLAGSAVLIATVAALLWMGTAQR